MALMREEQAAFLTPEQLQRTEQFRADVRSCHNAKEKLQRCVKERDVLLGEQDGLAILIAATDRVMREEWPEYGKVCRSKSGSSLGLIDQKQWSRFLEVVDAGSEATKDCILSLKKITHVLGSDFTRHYRLAGRGREYLRLFAAALTTHDIEPLRREVVILKLNQLMRQRHLKLNCALIRLDPNPIEHVDLRRLVRWSDDAVFNMGGKSLTVAAIPSSDLPPGLGFDKFGLLVRQPYAINQPGCRLPQDHEEPDYHESPTESELSSPPTSPGTSPNTSEYAIEKTASSPAARSTYDRNTISRCPSNVHDRRISNPLQEGAVEYAAYAEAKAVASARKRALHQGSARHAPVLFTLAKKTPQLCPIGHLGAQSTSVTALSSRRPLPEDSDVGRKRLKLLNGLHIGQLIEHPPNNSFSSQFCNASEDEYYRKVLQDLTEKADQGRLPPGSFGERNERWLLKIMKLAKRPDDNSKAACYMSADELAWAIESKSHTVPIFTHSRRLFSWDKGSPPMSQLFERFEVVRQQVSVQKPSLKIDEGDSYVLDSLSRFRDRLLGDEETDDSWSVLDLRSPLPLGCFLPTFLTGRNCGLWTLVRGEALSHNRAERLRHSPHGWRDDQEMVLLSQGGYVTGPHMDSLGLSTWLDVQEGRVLLVWLSDPNADELARWTAEPFGYTGGKWNYQVLHAGDTVVIPSGLVHAAYRLRGERTMTYCGRFLQWTGLTQWMKILELQRKNPHITNEDTSQGMQAVAIVMSFLTQRMKEGSVAELGGLAQVNEVSARMETFLNVSCKKGRNGKRRIK